VNDELVQKVLFLNRQGHATFVELSSKTVARGAGNISGFGKGNGFGQRMNEIIGTTATIDRQSRRGTEVAGLGWRWNDSGRPSTTVRDIRVGSRRQAIGDWSHDDDDDQVSQ
jgi:hypothetical protein